MDTFPINFRRHAETDNSAFPIKDISWAGGQPWYQYSYPRSFEILPPPQRDRPLAQSTLHEASPIELVFQDARVRKAQFLTTNGVFHDRKLYKHPNFMMTQQKLAPSMRLIHRIWPEEHERMKLTSQRLLYDSKKPFYNSTMKSEHCAHYPMSEFDYWNGPKAQVPQPRFALITKLSWTKPGVPLQEKFSIFRKRNPNISTMKFDYIDPRGAKHYVFNCAPN